MTDQPNVAEKINGTEPVITVEKLTEAEMVTPHDEDVPTFDFGELSYTDVRQLEKTYNKAVTLRDKNTQALTDDEREAVENQAEALMDSVYDSVALCITYMPRSWLVTRAPLEVDFAVAGELRKYLRASRIMDLVTEFKASQEKKA
jgi:hypothetical protein